MQTSKQLRRHKRRLNRTWTDAELAFEARLVGHKIEYKPQMILGFYILDFCIPDKMLNIEIDGGIHGTKEHTQYDKMRDTFVKKCGLEVIRIKNEHVDDFDFSNLTNLPSRTSAEFRSALAKANSLRGKALLSD